jgi:hypothetical protein
MADARHRPNAVAVPAGATFTHAERPASTAFGATTEHEGGQSRFPAIQGRIIVRKMLIGLTALSMSLPVAIAPADAQSQYRGRTHRHHYVAHRCHRHGGTTGALIGGGAGALVGSAVTHGIAGPIIGAAGGALLGRHIERHRRC